MNQLKNSSLASPDVTPASGHTETATLNIEGMTCASCSNFVERTLNRTPGVQRATVNLASEKATVEYVPTQIDRAGLKAAVEQAGYGVHEPAAPAPGVLAADDELTQRKATAYRQLLRRFQVRWRWRPS
jgi:Cu+-exporting ATPase